MQIHAIGSCYNDNRANTTPPFKSLIKDRSAIPLIETLSKSDTLEFKQIEKRLSKTKFWDMKISTIGEKFKELKFEFIDKKNKHGIITDSIYPYDKENDTIKIYSIIYGPENISKNFTGELKYSSSKRADVVYDKYLQNLETVRLKNFQLSPIESIKSKEIELNMLEEAAHFGDKNFNCLNTEMNTKSTIGNEYNL